MTYLTIRQTAAAVGVSEYYLRKLEKKGELPCIYSGNRCLVNVDRLREALRDAEGGRKESN